MEFRNEELTFVTAEGAVRVMVTAAAQHMWWSAQGGPQSGPDLVKANLPQIETIMIDKLMAGETEQGVVWVGSLDLESDALDESGGLSEVYRQGDEPDL